jgi:hypothetical protein
MADPYRPIECGHVDLNHDHRMQWIADAIGCVLVGAVLALCVWGSAAVLGFAVAIFRLTMGALG